MESLKLYTHADIQDDHIIVKLEVKFHLDENEKFTDCLHNLVHTVGLGGSYSYKNERPGAREEYILKLLYYNEDVILQASKIKGRVDLAIPVKMCAPSEGFALLLAIIYYASAYSFVEEFHVIDINFPCSYIKALPLPKYGTNILNDTAHKAPKIGLLLKPRSIINCEILNSLIYNAVKAGVDYVSDDELTVNPYELPFEERVSFITKLLTSIYEETGKKIPYIANITASYRKSLELAKLAQQYGVDGVMVNCITMGYDVIQELARNKKFKPFIVANVIGRSMISEGPNFKVSYNIHCLLARLSGADAVYTGPFIGNIKTRQEQALKFEMALINSLSKKRCVRPSYAVMTGGLNIKSLMENWKIYGKPTMMSMGTGLCTLLEEDINPNIIKTIVAEIFQSYACGGEKAVNTTLISLANKSEDYRTTIEILGYK